MRGSQGVNEWAHTYKIVSGPDAVALPGKLGFGIPHQLHLVPFEIGCGPFIDILHRMCGQVSSQVSSLCHVGGEGGVAGGWVRAWIMGIIEAAAAQPRSVSSNRVVWIGTR